MIDCNIDNMMLLFYNQYFLKYHPYSLVKYRIVLWQHMIINMKTKTPMTLILIISASLIFSKSASAIPNRVSSISNKVMYCFRKGRPNIKIPSYFTKDVKLAVQYPFYHFTYRLFAKLYSFVLFLFLKVILIGGNLFNNAGSGQVQTIPPF